MKKYKIVLRRTKDVVSEDYRWLVGEENLCDKKSGLDSRKEGRFDKVGLDLFFHYTRHRISAEGKVPWDFFETEDQ